MKMNIFVLDDKGMVTTRVAQRVSLVLGGGVYYVREKGVP